MSEKTTTAKVAKKTAVKKDATKKATRKPAAAKKASAPKTDKPVVKATTPTLVEAEVQLDADAAAATIVTDSGSNHIDTMFSHREVPWMKLGKLTTKPLTAKDAAREGNIDFEVDTIPVEYTVDGQRFVFKDRKVVVRRDTRTPLSVVGAEYPVLQYSDAFDFMDQLNPEYVAAGSLKSGKQGFMVAKAPENFNVQVLGEDPHEMYFVLRTSHDLSKAVEIMVMPLRMKCMNQLSLRSFTKGVENRWAVKHTSTMNQKLEEAHRAIKKLGDYVNEFQVTAERLASINLNSDDAVKVMTRVLPDRPKRMERIDAIVQLWKDAERTNGYNENGWGLVQAVSELYDWGRVGGTAESQFTGALQGQTTKAINDTALAILSIH